MAGTGLIGRLKEQFGTTPRKASGSKTRSTKRTGGKTRPKSSKATSSSKAKSSKAKPSTAKKKPSSAKKRPSKPRSGRSSAAASRKRGGAAAGAGPASASTTRTGSLSPAMRALVMVLAFVAMVGFAVVLARLTLSPSAASVPLTHSNLRPGDSIRNYLAQPAFRDTAKQLGGNILLGVPFGLLLPVLVPRARGLVRTGATAALVMVLVELAQGALVQGRAFDIDDVILNTSGAVLGYVVLGRRLGHGVHPRRRHWWHRWTKGSTAAAGH